MKLKKDKYDVLRDIESHVRYQVMNTLNNQSPNYGYGGNSLNLSDIITNAIAAGVRQGFETLLNNEYTDEDFEKDLTLR